MVDAVRLPDDIEGSAHGGPVFSTSVITLSSGQESRNQDWQIARQQWDVGYGVTDPANFEAVRAFFLARRGRARSFLFKDWSDYKATLEPVAAVTGDATKRQLIKTYADTENPYVRVIAFPVSGTLKVYVDTLLTTDYTLLGGVLTFASDPGASVVASYEFDIPVRFDVDKFDLTLATVLAGQIPSLPIVEVTQDDPS